MDWEKQPPVPEVLKEFERLESDEVFPKTYSGQAWFAAYRIWKAVKDNPEKLVNASPYGDIEGVDLEGWDGTGFMYGWALNAVRQMMGYKPGPNGAILTLGTKEEPPYPAMGTADQDLHMALGDEDGKVQ